MAEVDLECCKRCRTERYPLGGECPCTVAMLEAKRTITTLGVALLNREATIKELNDSLEAMDQEAMGLFNQITDLEIKLSKMSRVGDDGGRS